MSAPVQLDMVAMLDYDPRHEMRRAVMLRYLDGKPETYSDRHHFACLTPGEACPGCGHVFPAGGADVSGDHHMIPGATECTGRRAYLQHAQTAHLALTAGTGTRERWLAAVAAAAPCWTADELTAAVTA